MNLSTCALWDPVDQACGAFRPPVNKLLALKPPHGDVSWCVMLLGCEGLRSGAGYLLRRIKPNLDGVYINPQTSGLWWRRFTRDVKTRFCTSSQMTAGFLSLFLHAFTAVIESHMTLRFSSEGQRLLRVWESSGRLILRGLTGIN